MRNITEHFVDYLFDKYSYLSDIVIKKFSLCYDDYISVAQAGAKKNRHFWEKSPLFFCEGKATVIGYEEKIVGKSAAFINAFNAHSLELDDGHRFGMIHLGAPVFSALLAAKDEVGIGADAVRMGAIMGYEAASRLAVSVQPQHKKFGWHASGTCGCVGAAVGVAFAMGLGRCDVKKALTFALAGCHGMLEMQEGKSQVKPFNVARAAESGLSAAYMALTNLTVPGDIIGGKHGWLKMFSADFDEEKMFFRAQYFEMERAYIKPYACCRHTHTAVEAAIKISPKLKEKGIKEILVETYKQGIEGHNNANVKTISEAKLSMPYSVAAALLYGRADISVFEPLDKRVVALSMKVLIKESSALTAEYPAKRPSIVSVFVLGGEFFSCRVDYAKGEPEAPLSAEEILEKRNLLRTYRPV